MGTHCVSEFQVLYELRDVWDEVTGSGKGAFQVDTRIDRYAKDESSWDDLDVADLFTALERRFGFSCSNEEWNSLFRFDSELSAAEWQRDVAPQLTFGALARFVAERATVGPKIEPISFHPITVLGRRCALAGAFTGIERVAQVAGEAAQFAPGSRIIDTFRGASLDNFWRELRWWTEDRLPELPKFWRLIRDRVRLLGCLLSAAAMLASWMMGSFIPVIVTVAMSAVAFKVASACKRAVDPVPRQFTTFRDLAEWIVNNDIPAKAAS